MKLNWLIPLFAAAGLALAGCGGGSSSTSGGSPAAPGGGAVTQTPDPDERTPEQLATAATTALTAARTAVMAVMDDSGDATVMAADEAVKAAETAVMAAFEADGHDGRSAMLNQYKGMLTERKRTRMAAMDAKMTADNEMLVATAAKLFAGINAPNGDLYDDSARDGSSSTVNDDVFDARWGRALTDGPWEIHVGDPAARTEGGVAQPAQVLKEDKDAMVAALYGWQGSRWTATNEDHGTYEAMVYSYPGEPTPGAKFNAGATALPVVGDLDGTTGETAVLSTLTGYAARVASPSFDQGVGTKEFELPDNDVRVMLSGTYYGVAGTYFCTAAQDNTCAARKAAEGFELGTTLDTTNAFTAGGWTFKPTDPEARVTETPDEEYPSYGWWLRTHKNGDVTASAFDDVRGITGVAQVGRNGVDLNGLNGSATYMGGAVGKYAISAPTGGTNDAGHFTARTMLEANFGASKWSLTGTVDEFKVGDDSEARDWSVALTHDGPNVSTNLTPGTGAVSAVQNNTIWSIGGEPAERSGAYAAQLHELGDDGVPEVVTGTFYTEYGNSGKMVGAFGANKQ